MERTDPKGLGCDSPGGGASKDSQQHPHRPLQELPDQEDQAAGHGGLALLQTPLLAWAPPKTSRFPGLAGSGPKSPTQMRNMLPPGFTVTHKALPFWLSDEGQMQQLTLYFRGEILMCPTPTDI